MAMAIETSQLFQKTLSNLDLAMFCFPKSQPPDPYNCSLVSLQLLRLMTPVKSNALIQLYPRGVPNLEVVAFMRDSYGVPVSFVPLSLYTDMKQLLFPGFATFLQVQSSLSPLLHSIICARGINGNIFLIDPQTGKIYSQDIPDPRVKPLQAFIERHSITSINCMFYDTRPYSLCEHRQISSNTDNILATVAMETFFKRGQLIESSVLIPSRVPSSNVNMMGGSRRKRLRSRTRKHVRK